MFKPWKLVLIDEAGYNCISDEHIDKLADLLAVTGLSEIDRSVLSSIV